MLCRPILRVFSYLSLIIQCCIFSLPSTRGKPVIEFVPRCKNNEPFCEDVEFYPEQHFYQILLNSTYEEQYFTSETLLESTEVSDRFHPDKEYSICSTKTKIQFPKVARNVKQKWKFIYNFQKYKQGISTEECSSVNSRCLFSEDIVSKIKTKCVQKYIDVPLLVADKNGNPLWDFFPIPSACVCAYEPVINFNVLSK